MCRSGQLVVQKISWTWACVINGSFILERKRKRSFLWPLSLIHVNSQLDSLWTHLERRRFRFCSNINEPWLKVFYWRKSESDIAFRWVQRESNFMFTLCSNKDHGKKFAFTFAFAWCKWSLKFDNKEVRHKRSITQKGLSIAWYSIF